MSEDQHPHHQNEIREGDVKDIKGSIRNIGIRKEYKKKEGKTNTIGMIFVKAKAKDIPKQRIDDATFLKDQSKNNDNSIKNFSPRNSTSPRNSSNKSDKINSNKLLTHSLLNN